MKKYLLLLLLLGCTVEKQDLADTDPVFRNEENIIRRNMKNALNIENHPEYEKLELKSQDIE